MNGKIVGGVILLQQPLQGLALYYLQVYGYYPRGRAPTKGVLLVSIKFEHI